MKGKRKPREWWVYRVRRGTGAWHLQATDPTPDLFRPREFEIVRVREVIPRQKKRKTKP